MLKASKVYSTIIVVLAYVLCTAVACYTFLQFRNNHATQISILYADLLATVVIFGFSYTFRNSSIYDPYWSVIPPLILLGLARLNNINLFQFSASSIIFWTTAYWGIRLTHNWFRGWSGLNHEDWRYPMLRENNKKFAYLVDFSGVHLFPTLIVFVALLPCISAYEQMHLNMNPINYLGLAIFILAMYFETVGDNQLRSFVKNRKSASDLLTTGLWKYTRHPNYFGETMFWWSLYLMSWNPNLSWWYLVCPISITCLFMFISIPMMDKRMVERKPHYVQYMKKTSGLIPWFPKS